MVKTAIITGGTRGIGKAIALRLAKEHYNLVLTYFKDEEGAKRTLRECSSHGAKVVILKSNVAVYENVKQVVSEAVDKFSGVDALINNAGLNIDKPALEMTEWEWDAVVDTNMKGTFLVSTEAARQMMKQDSGGHIINIGATTGIRGRKNGLNYCASKAGIIVMTKCLAMELGPKIRVNCLIPGITLTDETEERFGLKGNLEEAVRSRNIPLERIGQPEEIAGAAAFLLSDEARYITGQKLIIDGGQYMY